ncbi:MAG: DUF72 domain-containing protein [Candidatus Bathyarchaeota archaeon]|nr:DUF72 domain-containing protein [Candidatus Bathyarchaeota archaeon]MDH5791190.1 DUF72 domain-containing protein [Candidatus Bathyarchaeota archaeon]
MIHTGCCGLAGMGLSRYAELFSVVELQSTFYRLPTIATARGWRSKVPQGFRFTLKAFQGVTHPVSSPTWRRAGRQKPVDNVGNYGHLRPTEENFECWRRTMEICGVLDARLCVIQLPPSFTCCEENIGNLMDFLGSVDRPVSVGVELRHRSWDEEPSKVENMLKGVGALHVVDPLVKAPAYKGDACHYRLHGLGKRLYSYRYTDEDLSRLKEIVLGGEAREAYVMFNNVSMKDDCLRFQRLLG